MKAAMNSIVDQERHVMFQDSANEARNRIKTMIRDQEEIMRGRTDEVFVAVRRDYRAVLSGGDTHGESLPKSQRLLRKDVMNILEGVETEFKQAIGIENDDKMVDKAVTLTDEMMGQLKSEKLEDIKNDGENAHPGIKQEVQEEADLIKSADHGPKSCPDVKGSVEDSTEPSILTGSEPLESTHNEPQHEGMDMNIEQEIKAEDSLEDNVNQGEEETEVWLPGGGSYGSSNGSPSIHSESETSVDL